MRINLFPRLRKLKDLPGVLGLYIECANTSVGINCIPELVELLKKSVSGRMPKQASIVLSSVNPVNLSGVEELSAFLKDADDQPENSIQVTAPKAVYGWLKALIMETDYSSDELKELPVSTYELENDAPVVVSPELNVDFISDEGGFFDCILRISFNKARMKLFFCETADLDAAFPELLENADLVLVNLAKYPSLHSGFSDRGSDIVGQIVSKLHEHGVKAAVLPTQHGILLTLPASEPSYREYADSIYKLKLGKIKGVVVHEKDFSGYKESVFPVSVEDESGGCGMLLGLDFGTVLHQRVTPPEKFDFSSIVVPSSSYRKVFCCVDLLDQIRDRNMQILCGRHMCDAVNYFKKLFSEACNRRRTPDVTVFPSDDDKTTRHVIFDKFELLMIPYAKGADSYIARIKDMETGEFMVYTEKMDDLDFLEKNLKGINTLVVAADMENEALFNKYSELLKSLQKVYRIQRLFFLYSGGTMVSDLDFS